MEYVKMPELLSTEVAKILAANMGELKDMLEANSVAPCGGKDRDDICCPKKVKFILFLNNVVILNINAVAEDNGPRRPV